MMSYLVILQLKIGNSFVLLAPIKDKDRSCAGQAKELTVGRKATANLNKMKQVKQKAISIITK